MTTQLRHQTRETTTYLDYLTAQREQTVELPPRDVEEDVESVFLPPAENVKPQWVYYPEPSNDSPGLFGILGNLLLLLDRWLGGPPSTERDRVNQSVQGWRDNWYLRHSGF